MDFATHPGRGRCNGQGLERTPPPIVEALVNRAQHAIFGYTLPTDAYYEAIINWIWLARFDSGARFAVMRWHVWQSLTLSSSLLYSAIGLFHYQSWCHASHEYGYSNIYQDYRAIRLH